jgi:hypothetical protein
MMCTSLAVLFDTNGLHKEHVLQNQIFFWPSTVVMCTVDNGLWGGDPNICVIRYTKHGLCADCTVQINATHRDDNHALLLMTIMHCC